jgi:acetate kinase
MGLTPLHGLPGGTRSGAIDPAAIFHYTNKAGKITHDKKHAVDVTVTQAEEILNKQSGWKAITGTSNFGEIVSGMGDDRRYFISVIESNAHRYFSEEEACV